MASKAYDVLTERILSMLDKGIVPWRVPWFACGAPHNLQSGRPYRGINVLVLACAGFRSPWWITYKQCKKRGGQVREGEKGTPVVFWNWKDANADTAGKSKRSCFVRYYTVFNVEQCDNLQAPAVEEVKHDPIPEAQAVVDDMPKPPKIETTGAKAFYAPLRDTVTVPPLEAFKVREEYYSTMFHELAHSTGHDTRLNRKGITGELAAFGSHTYSKEELVAECTAAFLCGHVGIETATLDNSAAYIQHWRRKISTDPKLVVHAAQAAQKAADYILDVVRN